MRRLGGLTIVEGVVVAALLAGTAWLGWLVQHNYGTHAGPVVAGVRFAPDTLPARSLTGQAAPLALGGARPELLLVLSTECPFCERNMPNWRRLAGEVSGLAPGSAGVTVLSVSPAADTEAFLAEHGLDLPVRLIDRSVMQLLGLEGYPATVAVDARTGSLAVWLGVLDEPEQEAVMAWASSSGKALPEVTPAAGGAMP